MSTLEDLIFQRDASRIHEMIISEKIDVNAAISNDRTPLSLAAACNYVDVMQVLLELGADVNKNNEGDLQYTPLEEAAREGALEAVKFLIEKGADIEKGNSIDGSALIGACIAAEKEILTYLISKGANVNHQNNRKETALHYLCMYAKQWGSSVITETKNGVTTVLENQRYQQHTDILRILIEKGADVNLETSYGYTPMVGAAESNADNFIEILASNGANINFQNSKGFSALHAACDRGNLEAALSLIKVGADINVVDNDGFTPLLGAAMSQNSELVTKLLEFGAAPSKDIKATVDYGSVSNGDTPLDVAKKLENQEIIEMLSKS